MSEHEPAQSDEQNPDQRLIEAAVEKAMEAVEVVVMTPLEKATDIAKRVGGAAIGMVRAAFFSDTSH